MNTDNVFKIKTEATDMFTKGGYCRFAIEGHENKLYLVVRKYKKSLWLVEVKPLSTEQKKTIHNKWKAITKIRIKDILKFWKGKNE